MAVKATQRGASGNMVEILAACNQYGFENPTVLLAGNAAGMPIVVAHTAEFMGRESFRLQTLWRRHGQPLQPGKGLTVPSEYRQALLEALKAL